MNTAIETQVIEVKVTNESMALFASANSVSKEVLSLTIENDEQYSNAAELTKKIRVVAKDLNASRVSITAPLDEAKKKVMDLFREPLSALESAQKTLDFGIRDYHTKKENERREAERKAEAVAKAEEERKKKLLEEQARKAEEAGREARAEALREKAEVVHVPIIAKPIAEAPKVAGISFRTTWKARVSDYKKIPQNFYINDPKVQAAILSVMDGYAKNSKGGLEIAGVEFYEEKTVAGRSF